MNENPRKTAVDIVFRVLKGVSLSEETDKFRMKTSLSDLDIRFVTEITSGTIRNLEFIDYAISEASDIKLNKISPFVMAVLRCGTYQILYMDKVPDSAAVNESVKIIRKTHNRGLCGFVNAVLRKVSSNGKNINLPSENTKRLSIEYSCPEWMVKRFENTLGKDAKELLASLNQKPSTFLRVNGLKTTADELVKSLNEKGWKCEKYFSDIFPDLDTIVKADKISDLTDIEEFKNGMFYVQDAAAAYAAYVLSPKKGDTVIDMCAAPGGKTTHMAELMENSGKIYAFDIYDKKTDKINENAKRLGISNIIVQKKDASVFDDEFMETADKILVDSPCSGLGIIRKKPDIKYLRKENDIYALADLSLKILLNAAKYLKKGGKMVFSTCTLTEEENTGVLFEFLNQRKDFKLSEIPCNRKNNGYITLYPHTDGCDGFFISLLTKE